MAEDYATSVMGDPEDFIDYCSKLSAGDIPRSDLMPALRDPRLITQLEEEAAQKLHNALDCNRKIQRVSGPEEAMTAMNGAGVYGHRGGIELHANISYAKQQVYLSGSVYTRHERIDRSVYSIGPMGAGDYSVSADIVVDNMVTLDRDSNVLIAQFTEHLYQDDDVEEEATEKLCPSHAMLGSSMVGWYMFPAVVDFDIHCSSGEPLMARVAISERRTLLSSASQTTPLEDAESNWLDLWLEAFEQPECRIEEWRDVREVEVDLEHEFFVPER
jgi:hypothetical protein